MKDKVMILSPAGANGNYIALTLLGLVKEFEFCYHMQGTHGSHLNKIKHVHIWDDNFVNLLNDDSYIILQNIFDEKFWFVIINWWEKNYCNVNPKDWPAQKYGVDWIDWQKKLWNDYNHPIVRAILNWFYAYLNRDRTECRRIDLIESTFNFGSFYKDYEATAKEFGKFGIEYKKDAYDQWRTSQQHVFKSFDQIQTLDLKDLTHDYQKAVKMGFLGMENSLSEKQCWEKYKEFLD